MIRIEKAIEAARKAREERKAAGLKTTMTPIEKLSRKPDSLRMAINAKCFDCEGQDADPGWRWRIGNCQITDCPLWNVRPYQRTAGRPCPTSLLVGTPEDTAETA